MTNLDKLKEDIQGMNADIFYEKVLSEGPCKFCMGYHAKPQICTRLCRTMIRKYLNSEYKPQIELSEDEKVILRNIDKKFEWIARDEDYELWIYEDNPIKGVFRWINDRDNESISVFNHLFQFIQWSDTEPYNIQELLKED